MRDPHCKLKYEIIFIGTVFERERLFVHSNESK